MKKTLRKTQAAKLIEEHFRPLSRVRPGEELLVPARQAGRIMVEIYRLLTDEMPQAAGIESEFRSDELPGVEFTSPLERDPNDVYYVHPGDPDILVPGDQNDRETKSLTEGKSQLCQTHPRRLGQGED